MSGEGEDAVRRRNAVTEYRKKLLQHKEIESRVRSGNSHGRISEHLQYYDFHAIHRSRHQLFCYLGFLPISFSERIIFF